MIGRSRGWAALGCAALVAATVVVLGGGTANAADPLLSRNKPVTVSSSGGCCPPGNAVDWDSTTRWASAAGVDPQWIYVDLGVSAHISRVRLQWDASCATAYRIETSADHSTWTPIFSTTTGAGGVDDLAVNATGRYVRMFGTHRCRTDATKGYSLQEYDVFGSTDAVPPTAPGPPTLVRSTPNSVTIRWGASTDDVGVVGYDVFRDGQLSTSTDPSTLTATIDNLNPNTPYGFYVQARDTVNNSPPSDTLQVTTPPSDDPTPPTAPTNVHTTAVGATCLSLAWTAATDNDRVTGYNIYDNPTGGPVRLGSSTTTSAQVCGLTERHTYHVTVRARDTNQEGPASSPQLTVTTTANCTDPFCAVTEVGTDNDVVWGLVTLPDGSLLYTRRDAHNIVRLNPATGAKTTVGTVPNVASTDGEGGLLGLAISPTFATDRWLYLFHTTPSSGDNDNRIVRIKMTTGNTLDTSSEQILVRGLARNKFHNGGRLRFGPDGKLYAGTGDAQNENNPQNRNSLNGKVLRINPDGTVPSDNPFNNYVWSYGHRNVQGLAFDSQGRLWEQEFGDSHQDETNLIQRGGNYGWPNCEGTFSRSGGGCGQSGFIAPKRTYTVAECSCSGLTIVNDVIYVAAQRGLRLWRLEINGSGVRNVQSFFQNTYGRLRTVEPAPDGGMWMATSNGGDKDSTPNNSNNQLLHVELGS
jgi:glucose/arabinose dehydrogenase